MLKRYLKRCADKKLKLLDLPRDVIWVVASEYAYVAGDDEFDSYMRKTPWALRVLLGPGALEENGDAYKVIAEYFRLRRDHPSVTWKSIHAELMAEYDKVTESDKNRRRQGRTPCIVEAAHHILDRTPATSYTILELVRDDRPLFATALACIREVSAPMSGGETPLHAAASRNLYELTLALLVAKGRNRVDEYDYQGHTPLDIACACGHADVASLLIAGGASASGVRRRYPSRTFVPDIEETLRIAPPTPPPSPRPKGFMTDEELLNEMEASFDETSDDAGDDAGDDANDDAGDDANDDANDDAGDDAGDE